jgi:NitT/TauT family transport system substrate-binding protein
MRRKMTQKIKNNYGQGDLMMMRFVVALALMAATSLGAAAQDVVRLGNLKFAHYGAVSYLKELAPKYNLKIDERVFAKGADIYPAMASDLIDIAASGTDGAVAARGNGVKLLVVSGFASAGARILGRPELKLTSMAQAKGLKVATVRGGIQDLLLLAELDKHGLSGSDKPGKDVLIQYFNNYADLNQALASKYVDIICQSEPQSTQAITAGWGTEIVKPYDTELGVPFRPLVMTEKMYNEKKDVAERVVKLLVDATNLFNKDAALAEKYVREQVFKGQLSEQDYKDAMANAAFDTRITAEHIDLTTKLMVKFELGKMVNPPKAADWVKLDLLEKANAALKTN